MSELWHLTCLEWKRSWLLVVGYSLLTLGLWGGVVFYFPVLRDGGMSADIVVFATALLAGCLAFRTFADDFREGRLEFLFSSGASPRGVFVSRLIFCVVGPAIFFACFGTVEFVRLNMTPENLDYNFLPVYARFRAFRESVYLYALPLLGLLLFASSIATRNTRLLAMVLLVAGGCYWLDRAVTLRAIDANRVGFLASAWSMALIPFFLALSAAAVWARRHEAERANVKVFFVAVAVLVLGIRHLTLEYSGNANGEAEVPVALALSPDGRQFAIESVGEWRPATVAAWSANVLEQSSLDGKGIRSRHVFVGNSQGALWCVSPSMTTLDSSGAAPPWLNPKTLRLRGTTADDDGLSDPRPLVLDTVNRRFSDAPLCFQPSFDPKARASLASIPISPGLAARELVKLENRASIWILPSGELEFKTATGVRRPLKFLAHADWR